MYPTTNLTPGTTSNEVTKLQQFLISQGFSIPAGATGYYGDQTKAAVAAWQAKNGVDAGGNAGYWGPKSIAAASGGQDPNKVVGTINGRDYNYAGDFIDRSLPIGGASSSSYTPPKQSTVVPPAQTIKDVEKYINDVVDSVVASGKTINPNITPEQLAAIDPAVFLQQAEASIAPEYAGKFASVKDNLSRTLSNLGYDLNLKKTDINKKAEETQLNQDEAFADRGLAFSGNRIKADSTLQANKNADLTAADVAAGRLTQSAVSEAEGKIGTDAVRSLGFGTPGGTPQYSSTPLVGSLTSERQYLKESMANELARQESERRAYATRSLSFS